MPKVASEVAGPLAKTKKIKMVSDDTGKIGAEKLTGEILDIMGTNIPHAVSQMTGVDITKQMRIYAEEAKLLS